MIKRKMTIIACLCFVAVAGVFFGVRQFGAAKKTLSISVEDLGKNGADNSKQAENGAEQIVPTDAPDQQQTQQGDENKSRDDVVKQDSDVVKVSVDAPKVPEKKLPGKPVVSDIAQEKIVDDLVSWGFQKSSGRTIKAIIV